MTNPRFRTAHDAGKFVAAQDYLNQDLNPVEYGAVMPTIPNLQYKYAQFEVRGDEIIDLHAPQPAKRDEELKTSDEWYQDWSRNGKAILFADGWDGVENFHDYWYCQPISQAEFLARVSKSILYI